MTIMSFVTTQTFEYREHKDELATLARVLDFLERRDVNGAIRVLLARHDQLIASQSPMVKVYDPSTIAHT